MSSRILTRFQTLETMAVLAAVSLLLSLLLHKDGLLVAALGLLLIGLFSPSLATVLAGWWLRLAEAVGRFNSQVILTLVFYLLLTPIAILYRLFAKSPLLTRKDADAGGSFYLQRNHDYSKADLEKPW